MVVERIISIVIGFVIVVVGSYVGTKMALNTFDRNFNPSKAGQSAPTNSTPDDKDR